MLFGNGARSGIFAFYINTQENIEADEDSRKVNVDTEWKLSG